MKLRMPGADEALECGKLIHLSGPELFTYIYGVEAPEIYEIFAMLNTRKGTPFSRENCQVAEIDGAIGGQIVCYPVSLVKSYGRNELIALMEMKGGFLKFTPTFMKMLARASMAFYYPALGNDELFIASLAVFPDFRKQGIAARLLKYAEKTAADRGFNKLSLYVELDNENAIRLYERAGYREVKKSRFPRRYRKFGIMGFYKMEKSL